LARKILLADDSVTAQNMGRKILADAGYDVSTVNNGSAALKRIAEIKPDLIVLDVYMPGYSGLEVCMRLKSDDQTSHIPVLLTVGKLEPFKPEEARRVRADAHIVKPFEASELLTAITKLEDRVVPQSPGSRFSSSASGADRFGGSGSGRRWENNEEADNGWKTRLGFPTKKKKKEETEEPPEDVTAAGNFREFRKGKPKPVAASSAKAAPGVEPERLPDIPRDITPEELDALSALAARLDAPTAETENAAPSTERRVGGRRRSDRDAATRNSADQIQAEQNTPAQAQMPEASTANTAVEVLASVPELQSPQAKNEDAQIETTKPETTKIEKIEKIETTQTEGQVEKEIQAEALAPTVEAATALSDAPPSAVEGRSEVPTRGERSEPVVEAAAAAADAVAAGASAVVTTQESGSVDKTDEPALAAVTATVQHPVEEQITKTSQAEAITVKSETTGSSVLANATATENPQPGAEQPQPEASKTVVPSPAEPLAEKFAQSAPIAVAANTRETMESEAPAPSDEELAQALRLLTPATAQADVSAFASPAASAGPRWIAEAVALSREEATISLEAEMFRTFASLPSAISGSEMVTAAMTGVAAIAAAVENRLAEAELLANVTASPKQAADASFTGAGPSEPRSAECSATEPGSTELGSAQRSLAVAVAETRAEAPAAPIAAVPDMSAQPGSTEQAKIEERKIEEKKIEHEKIQQEKVEAERVEPKEATPEKLEAERQEFTASIPETGPAQEFAAATFANAAGHEVEEAKASDAATGGEMAVAVATAAEEENQESSSDAGGEESMGNIKSKSGKSNWHQIRTAPAGATPASSDAAETAEAPKAMAVAASAEGSTSSSSSSSAPDASAIASIVDSVMADLRPKIVEEIAKKLAGK
jgi:CheY-like chemotaxis protein